MSVNHQAVKIGVVDYDPTNVTSALERMRSFDDLRDKADVLRSTWGQGYWIVTRAELGREIFQDPCTYSNGATQPHIPDPSYVWIPEMLDAPEHTTWRKLLAPYFTPRRVAALAPQIERSCRALVESIAPRGRCDLHAEFSRVFPTEIFLSLMGLPADRVDEFMEWEDAILNYSSESDPDGTRVISAMGEVQQAFSELLELRRRQPEDDLVTACLTWEIDGKPIPEADLLNMCLLMFMAGLDTVTQQLTYSFLHLATHPADRERIVRAPDVIPTAVEELLRYYTIVLPSRRLTRDAEFHGSSFKKGEMVYLPLAALARDTEEFEGGCDVDFDRPNVARHMAFGAGAHRCLGSTLARTELRSAITEWHRLIPSYRLADGFDVSEIHEHAAGGVLGVDRLELQWDA